MLVCLPYKVRVCVHLHLLMSVGRRMRVCVRVCVRAWAGCVVVWCVCVCLRVITNAWIMSAVGVQCDACNAGTVHGICARD